MNYIKTLENGDIICEHPKVEKFWMWGGFSPNAIKIKETKAASIILIDGTKIEFFGDENVSEISKANEFLNTI